MTLNALTNAALENQAVHTEPFADQLVTELSKLGVTTYFGVPGGAIEPLFNALARKERSGSVRLVATRSESGAGFAADGYYRATGKAAVCTATTGPGISNLLTAVMAAHADRIPMLVITPQVALKKQGRGALQESSMDGYDLPKMFAECTKYSTCVTHPDQLAHKLRKALSKMMTAPAGPVHLSIPSDVLAGAAALSSAGLAQALRTPEVMDLEAVEDLLTRIVEANAAVFYVGDDAGPEAHRLADAAERLGAQLISSPAGKRWISHTSACYKGVLGFSGHPEAREAINRADLIVTFGATFDELSTNAWSVFPDVPIYAVDRHSEHVHRLPNARPVVANPARVIEALAPRLPPAGAEMQRPLRRATPAMMVQSVANGPVHPKDLMHWVGLVLPQDVAVHVDAGNSFSWSTKNLVRSAPDTYRVAMGLATMCWAIGSVIGATVATRRRTICITGDGSMLMSSLELTVAVEQNLPVTYIVLNDSSLGMVRHGQKLAGAESVAHQIAHVRFDQVARACGAEGIRVDTLCDLSKVGRKWLAHDDNGPCVIDVRIDPAAVPPIGDRVMGLAVGVTR